MGGEVPPPESYGSEPPSRIADEDIEVGLGSPGLTPSTILVLLARTQRLRLRILHLVNAPGASRTYDECHSLAAELNSICCADLDLLRSMSNPQPTDFHIKVLDGFTRTFVLALHAPFADQATTKPSFYFSRRIRMEVSALLLGHPLQPTAVENQACCHDLAETTSHAVAAAITTTTPPGLKSVAAIAFDWDTYAPICLSSNGHFALVYRQATTALCLDLISELEENAFPNLDRVSRKQLRNVVRDAVGAFARRLRDVDGADYAREFFLFACAEAYIGAMLRRCSSEEVDEATTEAARAALAVCCEVMEGRSR